MGSEINTEIVHEISQEYSNLSTDCAQILNLIFFPFEKENTPKIKSFIHLYTEIFNYSDKHTLPEETFEDFDGDSKLLAMCIQKHREIFRQCFRGVQYLPTKKFREVSDNSLSTAMSCLLSKDMCNLESIKSRIKLEHKWLEVINEQRTKDLEVYIMESTEKFMITIRQKFPLLYESESLNYIDEQILLRKLTTLLASSKKQFLSQLPFRDSESKFVITQAVFEFKRSLEEKVTTDLIARNLERRKLADAYISEILAESLKHYRDKMETFLLKDYKSCLLHVEVVVEEHKKLIKDKISTLTLQEPFNRVRKLQVAFLDKYLPAVHDVLKILLNKWIDQVILQLKSYEKDGKLRMGCGLTKIKKIFGEIGMHDIADEFKSHVEDTLTSMFQHVQDTNRAAITKLEIITKPCIEEKEKYNMNFKINFQNWKVLYMKKIVYELHHLVKDSTKLKDRNEVIHAIQTAKATILQTITQGYSYLYKEDVEEVEYFMEELKEELLNDLELLTEIVRRFNDSNIKFQEICFEAKDFPNGVEHTTKVRLQSILGTPEKSEISFEELRFNEWKRQNHIFQAALSIALPESLFAFRFEATPNCDIIAAFDKCLKFTNNSNEITFGAETQQ